MQKLYQSRSKEITEIKRLFDLCLFFFNKRLFTALNDQIKVLYSENNREKEDKLTVEHTAALVYTVTLKFTFTTAIKKTLFLHRHQT